MPDTNVGQNVPNLTGIHPSFEGMLGFTGQGAVTPLSYCRKTPQSRPSKARSAFSVNIRKEALPKSVDAGSACSSHR